MNAGHHTQRKPAFVALEFNKCLSNENLLLASVQTAMRNSHLNALPGIIYAVNHIGLFTTGFTVVLNNPCKYTAQCCQ